MAEPLDEPTQSGPTITVTGLGVASAQPDGVTLVLTARHRAESAEEALENTAGKAQALESLFLELGIDRERWVTAGISLEEWAEWDESSRREMNRGYVGSSRIVVTLPDVDSLGALLAEAVARTDAAVEGPGWNVSPSNPAHDESRREAMADARRRAETYADAAGLVIGDLLQVVEVGADHPTRRMRLPFHPIAIGLSGGSEMPAHAEGLQVVAAVDVTYSLTKA